MSCIQENRGGYQAFSCDLKPSSGGKPEYHIQSDVREVLLWDSFGVVGTGKFWHLIIAHPVCRYIANSGVQWLNRDSAIETAVERRLGLVEAVKFFRLFIDHPCELIATENPIPHKYAGLPKYNQIVHPWMFGHPEQKATCLWLKGLPKLQETNNVRDYMLTLPKAQRQRIFYLGAGKSEQRSKTFPGIAEAMAIQWGQTLKMKYE